MCREGEVGLAVLAKRVEDLEKSGEREQAQRVYEEKIFPLVKRDFLQQASELLSGKRYRYLILTAGKTPEPLVLSVSAFNPAKVYFLYTKGSEVTVERVVEDCSLSFRQVEKRMVSPWDARDVYAAVHDIVKEIGGVRDLAIDITGGTKVMVGGCCMAAALLKADIFYVESEFGWCLGKSKPGTERLTRLRNPYEVFGHVEMEIGAELFNSHVYTQARGIFNRLAENGVDESRTRTYLLLSEAYDCWDRFHYRDAKQKLRRVLERQENAPVLPKRKAELLEDQLGILEILSKNETSPLKNLLRDERFTATLMTDLYANAERRMRQGRYDDGIIRLYRILELISQSRLARNHGIDASSVKGIPADAAERFAKVSEVLHGCAREVPERLGLIDGWALLWALGDEGLGIRSPEELKALKDTVQRRNLLMVEHSNEARDREEYKEFKSFVLSFLRSAVPDIEQRSTKHIFIEL